MEFREPLFDLVSAAFRFDLDAFDDAAVRVGPAGERLHALRLEQVGSEVALHVVQLGHGIGYRRAGREHDVASMSRLAQVLALVEQVLAFLRGGDVHAGHADRGGDGEVLELVGLVDEQHVHAEVLEVDPFLVAFAAAQRLSLSSTRMRSFSACLTVRWRLFSILPISSFSFFAEKSLPSDSAIWMLSSISALRRSKYFSRRSGLTCMRWNVSCRTMTASQSPAATFAQKRAAPLPVPSASVMESMFASG